MEREFTLSTPLTTHSGEVTKLTLKLPRAQAWVRYGVPFSTVHEGIGEGAKNELRFNPKAMLSFLSDMSGVRAVDLELLDGRDFHTLLYVVVGMLNESSPTTP